MKFAQPYWLWALLLVPALIALYVYHERNAAQILSRLVAARLQDQLTAHVSLGLKRLRFALVLLGLAFAFVAMARPQWGYIEEQSRRKGRDLLIAIDTSKSMQATDLAPNRLTRAKLAAQDLIGQLGGDRVGLVAFAGTAFLQAPLTIDHSAVLGALQELDTDIIPQGGTNIAAAIATAKEAFGKGESQHRALIIFTDGEDLEAAGKAAAEELKGSVTVFTVGIGSAEGSLIPLGNGRGGEFLKDDTGQIVKSRLDESTLTQIAKSTGGFYVRLENGPEMARRIVQEGLGSMTEHEIDAKLSRRPIERYYWPLGASLVALMLSLFVPGRRAKPRAVAPPAPAFIILCLCLLLPINSFAKNQALEAYEQADYEGSLKEFSRQLTKQPESPALNLGVGSAAYKTGDLDKALQSFSKAATATDPGVRTRAEYNLGNTLFKRGQALKDKEPKIQEWKNALQHYDQALEIEPANKDAKFNRDTVANLIKELEKEQQQEQQDKKDKQDQKDQKDQKDKKDQQNQDGKNDQKDKGSQDKDQKNQKDQEGEKDQKDQKDGEQDQKDGKQQKQNGSQKGDPKNDNKSGDQEDQKDKDQGDQDKDSKGQGKKPQSDPQKPDKKREGELQNNPQYDKGKQDDAKEQEAEAKAAAEGRMTPQQAKNLLESLRAEDQKVQLIDPSERQVKPRNFKDW